jgi:hypothetical protein
MIGNSLEEPDFLLLDILNYDLIGLQQCIENCGLKLNWYESLKKLSVSNVKKINIISGNKDRYLPFSKLLSEQFSNIFSLKVIDGQHHIIYTYPYEVSLLI